MFRNQKAEVHLVTPGKLRALLKDLWANSPITFQLDDGTPLRLKGTVEGTHVFRDEDGNPYTVKMGDREVNKQSPCLTLVFESAPSDTPGPAQTVQMEIRGATDIDQVAGEPPLVKVAGRISENPFV